MRHPGESALLTDLHAITMLQAYFSRRMNDTAVFEFFARKLAAGLAQVAAYLAELRFTEDELADLARRADERQRSRAELDRMQLGIDLD